jgi:hypothetical protein
MMPQGDANVSVYRIEFWSLGWEKVNVVAVVVCGIESRLT